jgi:maltose alpha-D-glucosyltransferase/alpha-amylase
MTGDPQWYKDAVLYELHVRAFLDSRGTGMGDFRGLTSKLDYLQDLGVTALWLLPFYPSPLRDDGYDISDYFDVHPAYGTLTDFKAFLREAHHRGLRVITELVLNHTSDQHPWFQRARRAAPGSRERNFYVWSDTPDRFKDVRIVFRDFEPSNWSYDPVAKAYYWHRFYAHQPDLNFDHPETRRAMFRAVDFWLGLGVDGLRLDAVPYLFEREGTPCENLPETHAFLRELRAHIDAKYTDRMLLAEANQWPEDAVSFFGRGDECHMAFHFPIMPRLYMAAHMEDRFPIVDILQQTPALPESCQWALFLRNHDELTLETVTDEERDYMYRFYANDPQARINLGIRRRLAPLLGNNRRKIELLNALLFSLPGTPVIYYGDEIGMGDNIYVGDRNGVRTPMQWSADKNAGFSRANPQRLYLPINTDPEHHYEAVNVEVQQNNPHSLLWWTKRLIALRKRHRAFGRGTLEVIPLDNRKVLAFVRRHGDEVILVVANLSRFVQHAPLDLAAWRGRTPVELFGGTLFPAIGDAPYYLTLGPHSFLWFLLRPAAVEGPGPAGKESPPLEIRRDWTELFADHGREPFLERLAAYLPEQPWFGAKPALLKSVAVTDVLKVAPDAVFLMVQAEFREGPPESYLVALAYRVGAAAKEIFASRPTTVVTRVHSRAGEGVLCDPFPDPKFGERLLDLLARRRRLKGRLGEIHAFTTKIFKGRREALGTSPDISPVRGKRGGTSLKYGGELLLRIRRRLEPGLSPDLEIGTFLTEKVVFPHTPDVAGHFEYRRSDGVPVGLAVLQAYVPHQGVAWSYTLDDLGRFFEAVLAEGRPPSADALRSADWARLMKEAPPVDVQEAVGSYLVSARLLGRRTAEMHLALAQDVDDEAFRPEPFTPAYRRVLYQSMRTQAVDVLHFLRRRRNELPADLQPFADGLVAAEPRILERFQKLLTRRMTGMRIRIHGDFHLGRILYTGKDFVVTDFEGDLSRPISERRIKRSPLRDLATLVQSFRYATFAGLRDLTAKGSAPEGQRPFLASWAAAWYRTVAGAFLAAYAERSKGSPIVPDPVEELPALLDPYLAHRGFTELSGELHRRTPSTGVPLASILEGLAETGV